ncbi:GNAT family N-acetyltransferase [Bradyrhizobium genosp. P]|uniref:GNAT family N-acetyltransferase n=1 Tax=Bradyrhizobium genosp. P TaxID=83641 RepID=UPI003CFB39B0
MTISFRSFEERDLPEYRSWFSDAELSRRLSFPTDEWFAYTRSNSVRCWLATDAQNGLVGQIQIDEDGNGAGHFDMAIKPSLRRMGLGAEMLRAFLREHGGSYSALHATVETDNWASIACLQRCGFEPERELDADGFMQFHKVT